MHFTCVADSAEDCGNLDYLRDVATVKDSVQDERVNMRFWVRGRTVPTATVIVAVNRRVDPPLAKRLADEFVEVLIAPEYTADAAEILKQKPATRILEDRERRRATIGERDYRRVLGGFLVQDADAEVDDREGMEVRAGELALHRGVDRRRADAVEILVVDDGRAVREVERRPRERSAARRQSPEGRAAANLR